MYAIGNYRGLVAPGLVGDVVAALGDDVLPALPLWLACAQAQTAYQLPQIANNAICLGCYLDALDDLRPSRTSLNATGRRLSVAQEICGVRLLLACWPRRRLSVAQERRGCAAIVGASVALLELLDARERLLEAATGTEWAPRGRRRGQAAADESPWRAHTR